MPLLFIYMATSFSAFFIVKKLLRQFRYLPPYEIVW
jgi:hypothetical protein